MSITPVLDPREKLRKMSVRVGRVTFVAEGRVLRMRVDLGARRHRRVRARVTERIRVGRHREKITYTLLYHRC